MICVDVEVSQFVICRKSLNHLRNDFHIELLYCLNIPKLFLEASYE